MAAKLSAQPPWSCLTVVAIMVLMVALTRSVDSGVTLDFYFGTGSKSSNLNEIFFMCYK
jgi:hypothetical protein